MFKSKKVFLLSFLGFLLIGLTIIFTLIQSNREFLSQFQSYSVTIDNQSSYDVVSLELGVLTGTDTYDSVKEENKHIFSNVLKSGEKKKIKPNISLGGKEGGVYLGYVNSEGAVFKKGICSYTESLTGFSEVIITDNGTEVIENCW
ncbi:hypothetical protein [Paenibacillus sp. FSL H8-0537]|uniref:hypothetical protein n=1 Tax=Paenibacillus sp. FSL H8-0537 TaxID=2921399 RepID=UPI0031014D3A